MIRVLAAAALAITLAACSAPESLKPVRSSVGKVALPEAPPPPLVADDPIMCPADVKTCPDGSYVSRNSNKGCAFARCPGETQP
ncbi:MAG: hypothetical protein GZ085_11735 [Sulfuriferula multivorans]|uniref:Lipoprotein n=1 Tax=Sulfuriferula multivorans TaxID=1559896 RepID=A0A7C9P8Y3_9PROT|nr:hypothetical protein [Sulfuriferula multivorans]